MQLCKGVKAVKYSELRFGQIVSNRLDGNKYLVLGTFYESSIMNLFYHLDSMYVSLYPMTEHTFEEVLDTNRTQIGIIADIKLIEESKSIRQKAEFWLLKSRLCVNYLPLKSLEYPEINYMKLMREKKRLQRFEIKLEERSKEAIKQGPVAVKDMKIKSNRIYLFPFNDKQNYYYIFKHKRQWFYENILDKDFILNLNETNILKLNPNAELIDTRVNLLLDSDYINRKMRVIFAEKW